jgi:membrane protease YdiL (CAAX protease family)
VRLVSYFAGVGLLTVLIIACALPFAVAGVWQSRARNWRLFSLVGVLLLTQTAVTSLPRINGFGHLHWNWQGSLLSVLWPLLLVRLAPEVSLTSIGVTARLRRGWLKPSIVALLIALAVPAVFFALGSRLKLTAEGWIYLSTMPGLAEELVFRGVIQSLLNRAFPRSWNLAGAPCGWGLVITAVLFAGANGLVGVDAQLHPHFVLHAGIPPLLMSLVSGWVRERTDSIWPSVFGHNLSNLVIPVATICSAIVH